MFKHNKLYREQVDSLFGMALMATTGNLIVALLSLIIFYPILKNKIYIFVFLFIFFGLYRYIIIWKYNKLNNKIRELSKWVYFYMLGIVSTALIWSIGTIYITQMGIPIQYEFLLFSIIIGLAAAGLATFGMIFYSYSIYVIALLIPYNIFLLFELDKFHLISAVLIFMAFPYFLRASYGYAHSFRDLIGHNQKMIQKEKNFSDATLNIVIKLLEEKDLYTVGHAERVSNYCVKFGKELNLVDKEIEILRRSAYLHDIGKISIPDRILTKKGPLSDKEYDIIKSHPQKGYEILKMANNEIINQYLSSIKHHHERYDGLGYPDGLKKDEIPLYARIISIVDTYDAMTSTRSYRNALSDEHAMKEIKRGEGKQFDPELTKLFFKIIEKKRMRRKIFSKFISSLEKEHDEILEYCSLLREKSNNREEAFKLLLTIKNRLEEHLQKEDELLYPPLVDKTKDNKDFQKSLSFFIKNITKVSHSFEDLFQAISDKNKEEKDYRKYLNLFEMKLYERIKKEESIIFPVFIEKIDKIIDENA